MKNSKFKKQYLLLPVFLLLVVFTAADYFGFNPFHKEAEASGTIPVAQVNGDVQEVTTVLKSRTYEPITVQVGIPVRWTIQAEDGSINGCNNTMEIPEYNIKHKFTKGDNVIEFTPTQTGTFPYSCWMGMINSKITVVDDSSSKQDNAKQVVALSGFDLNNIEPLVDTQPIQQSLSQEIVPAQIIDGVQIVNVRVDGYGYSPSIVAVQKGIETKFVFDAPADQLTYCNQYVLFPQFEDYLDLSVTKETKVFTPDESFTYQCSMGMLTAYVAVVDDINQIDKEAILSSASESQAAVSCGCCN